MLRSNITVADFSGGVTRITTAKRWQYDYGQLLSFSGIELPSTFECQFSNIERGEAITQIGSNNTVTIPDAMFLRGAHIYAWVFLHTGEDDGETEYMAVIPIMKRAQPSDTPPTPVEQSVITQAIAALNAAVDQTGADVIAAEAAQAAAELAQEKAEDAKTAAETAQGKAEEAQTAAEAAATGVESDALKAEGYAVGQQNGSDVGSGSPYYHNNAKYYKEQAASSATAASDAQTAAETAQGKAEDAQAAAESAATGLEGDALKAEGFALGQQNGSDVGSGSPYYHNNAKYYNEQAASSATAASDAQVAAEAAQRRAEGALNEKADIIIASASGSIASFADGAALPIVDLIVALDPIQDLHGYDSPWPAGGGKNKCSYDTAYEAPTGNTATVNLFNMNLTAGVTYTFSCKQSASLASSTRNTLCIKPSGGSATYENSGTNYNPSNLRHVLTYTAPSTGEYTFQYWGHTLSEAVTLSEWQVEESASFTSYAPYSNICPISGRTGVELYRTGKNLLPTLTGRTNNAVTYEKNADGSVSLSGTASGSSYYQPATAERTILKAGTYYISGGISSDIQLYLAGTYTDGTALPSSYDSGSGKTVTYTKDAEVYVQIYVKNGTNTDGITVYPMISDSSGNAYAPYQGNIYSVSWQTEAGTVYGATLQYIGGGMWKLMVYRAYKAFNGTEDWDIVNAAYFMTVLGPMDSIVNDSSICSHYLDNPNISTGNYQTGIRCYNRSASPYNGAVLLVRPDAPLSMSLADFETWLATENTNGTPLQVCYELATPIEYTLTTDDIQEILTLFGTNNIWANSGDVSVSCRADTKLYIDNKIAQAIAAALNA